MLVEVCELADVPLRITFCLEDSFGRVCAVVDLALRACWSSGRIGTTLRCIALSSSSSSIIWTRFRGSPTRKSPCGCRGVSIVESELDIVSEFVNAGDDSARLDRRVPVVDWLASKTSRVESAVLVSVPMDGLAGSMKTWMLTFDRTESSLATELFVWNSDGTALSGALFPRTALKKSVNK